jgi:hypothetical protein
MQGQAHEGGATVAALQECALHVQKRLEEKDLMSIIHSMTTEEYEEMRIHPGTFYQTLGANVVVLSLPCSLDAAEARLGAPVTSCREDHLLDKLTRTIAAPDTIIPVHGEWNLHVWICNLNRRMPSRPVRIYHAERGQRSERDLERLCGSGIQPEWEDPPHSSPAEGVGDPKVLSLLNVCCRSTGHSNLSPSQ